MKRIEIFEDHRGVLCLRQYDNEGKIDLNLRGSDIHRYLGEVSKENIKNINTSMKSGQVHSISAVTDKHKIDLLELEKLDKYEDYLHPLTSKIKKTFEDESIRKYREKSGTGKTHKVTRENKYSKLIMEAASLLVGVIFVVNAVGNILIPQKKDEEKEEDLVPPSKIESFVAQEEVEQNYVIPSEEETIVSLPSIEDVNEVNVSCIEIECEDLSQTDKATYAKETYGALIEKYANRYGVDPNIVLAIATQERGVHSSTMDKGGATGLMQIQNGIWLGNNISAYNYETGTKDTFKVDKEMIQNLETNVMMGCMYFQNCMDYMDNNVLAAIQCYNMGNKSVKKVLNAYAKDQGTTIDMVLADQQNNDWMNYRYLISRGDQNYVENVARYLDNDVKVSVFNKDNTKMDLQISRNEAVKTI